MSKRQSPKSPTGAVTIFKTILLLLVAALTVTLAVRYLFDGGANPTVGQTPQVSASAEPLGTPDGVLDRIKYINEESVFVNFGDRKSSLTIVNHNTNTVDFVVCIQLADGTEIYRSELISPGNKDENVSFTKTLGMGVHNAMITYYSYGGNGAQLSSASFELEIVVG